MSAFIAEPISRNKIRAMVNLIREQFELTDEKCFPVVPFFEFGLNQFDEDYNYEIASISEMPNDYGLTFPEENKIIIREDVYERAINGVGRDRFTIAHEIGHYIMHRPSLIALARNVRKIEVPAYKNPEWQANTFAGELLAPPNVIRGLSQREISLQCGVSFEVAGIQLKNL